MKPRRNENTANFRRSRRNRCLVFSAALSAVGGGFGTMSAKGADTWIGGRGNWLKVDNWGGGGPQNGDEVLVDGGNAVNSAVTIDTDAVIGALTLDTGDSMTLQVGRTLTLTSQPTINGTLKLASAYGSPASTLMLNGPQVLSGAGMI